MAVLLEILDPESYVDSQALVEAGALGVVYPSVRCAGGTCLPHEMCEGAPLTGSAGAVPRFRKSSFSDQPRHDPPANAPPWALPRNPKIL